MTRMVDAKRQKNSVVTSPQIIPKPRDNVASTRLAYMADLLLELKDMATAEGHATLAGLLALAHMEALDKSRS